MCRIFYIRRCGPHLGISSDFQTRKFFAAWVKRNWKRFCWMPRAGGPWHSPSLQLDRIFRCGFLDGKVVQNNESDSGKGNCLFVLVRGGKSHKPYKLHFFGCKWKRETPLLDEFYGGIHWKFASCFHSLHYDGDLQLSINCLIVLEASGPLSVWEMFLWEYWTQKRTELRHSSKHIPCIRLD